MPRPHKVRIVREELPVRYFKPRGIPLTELDEVLLTVDGLEALRLADAEGLEHITAAELMGVSRPTFSRLLAGARTAVATALARGCAIRIDGGAVRMATGDDVAEDCPGRRMRRRRGHCRWRETNVGDQDDTAPEETPSPDS
ncbi:DUF134 domain-containing protein [Blastochloris viridis]|uniref:UPF0251 protein BV133_3278 n=1 Tax=Blastochloris viridis TaxID=1079 RepID=A0A0H5BK04_BLAVI|nr:DUF134 domain-containing protein [Blastochloris viridis]ALK09257.1 hypothetical protein BVIR_1474 [Blastochloris viridis]BAS00872.1 UPF0251 protein CTC_01373 [Blastochloris viridis]CUU41920.1 hypothetical protein BVIRIDIS_09190 [Blastochloris viridis]